MMIYAWHWKCQNWALIGNRALCWSLGTAPAAAVTGISFVAQILLFGQVLAQLLLWREEANTQPPFRGWVGFNFCLQQALKNCNLTRQALGFVALTPALQSGNGRRKEQIPGLWHFAQSPWHQHSKEKKKKINADVHVLVGLSRISTAVFWKINSRGKSCGEQITGHKLCCTIQRIASVSRQRN